MSVSINNSFIRGSSIGKYTSNDFVFQNSRLKLFGDIFFKKHPKKTEFILQTKMINRGEEVVSQTLRIYEDSAKFMHERGSKLKIVNIISDPNIINNNIYTVRMGGKPDSPEYLLKAIPFNRYEE